MDRPSGDPKPSSSALTRLAQLPVHARAPRVLFPSMAFTGPGRTLHEIYNSLGDTAEKHANRAAHSLGLGPVAVADRISKFFGDGKERERALNGLRDEIPRKLEKDCARLMKYAFPCVFF
ncbi:hypothetical protein C8R44DRAFT_260551 [Mycena epipterygia]|nr:hypothetical protein C8R44DRAFT_260551 [Mycena epipterygia]